MLRTPLRYYSRDYSQYSDPNDCPLLCGIQNCIWLHRQAGNGDLKQSSQDKEGGGRGVLKWLDDALREESGYDYDGGGEIGTAGYMRLESLERKQTQQEHNPPQGDCFPLIQ